MEMRLQKYLAQAGVASRRKSEELIASGQVLVNGVPAELGTKVIPGKDTILCRGKAVVLTEEHVYFLLHKPEGYVTTAKDQFGRPAVLDLLKDVPQRIFPVGRLDYDTSGLLLLTNDGTLTYRLTHPKHFIPKIYEAKLYGTPDFGAVQRFNRGIVLDGRRTRPARLVVLESEERFSRVQITIHEGRNRQVRKMCQEIKHPVAALKRIATGELQLGELPVGKYRPLTKKEIAYLKSL